MRYNYGRRLEEIKTFAVSQLTDLRTLLAKPSSAHEARAMLAEQFGRFALSPVSDSGGRSYTAKGSADIFGREVLPVYGGGGGKWTEHLSVAFEWLAAA